MSETIYVRRCERYTIWEATEEPIEVDVDKLRKCEPPYEGSTTEELWAYLEENVYNWENQDEFIETNKEVYGEDAAYDLTFESCDMEVYSDSRDKYAQEWLDIGEPNEEWRKMGGFEVRETSVDNA